MIKTETNKDKGRTGLAMAIGYYGSTGRTVSIPLNDTQDYDLIIDDGGVLKKVQVRCTGYITKHGRYSVSVKSCGGTNGGIYGHVIDSDIDILFVVCVNGWMFEIPKDAIKQRSTINLDDTNTEYSQYLVSNIFMHTYTSG